MTNRNGLYFLLGAIIIAAAILYTRDDKLPVLWEKDGSPLFHEVKAAKTWKGPEIHLTSSTFRDIAQDVVPAVVNISTIKKYRSRRADPFWEFFGRRSPGSYHEPESLGTGVIINEDGYILTNRHVVDGSDEIHVTLSNNKSYEARLIGKDGRSDMALLKINPLMDLPFIPMGDSDHLLVGDWVIAVGNPFGLGHTVTTGIVSAKDRGFDEGNPYQSFIQTDAAINPGNSGGPLINLQGELVGINTAIVSNTGQYSGVGFSIPINLIKDIIMDLKEDGRVERPYLGVSIRDTNEYLIRRLNLPEDSNGALIAGIYRRSPAHKAGLEPGDLICEFNGKAITQANDLTDAVIETTPGDEVEVKFYRHREKMKLNVTIGTFVES